MNFITGNKFKALSDDYIDQSKPFLDLAKKPKIIFVFTDWIDQFKQKILPFIDYDFKLITHNADCGVYKKDLDLLNDPRLVRWFGMNCHIEHEKLTPIPIGIANQRWPHGNEELLSEIRKEKVSKKDRVYCNFDISTNPDRELLRKQLLNNVEVDIEDKKIGQEDYWRKVASYRYIISPPGNSIDCHRIWESCYLGTIPICLEHIALKSFQSMPIILMESYLDLGRPLAHRPSKAEQLDFSYWKNLIL